MWPFAFPHVDAAMESVAEDYRRARPFPHLVLDDWFETAALEEISALFDVPDGWQEYEDRKRGNMTVRTHPFFEALNSAPVLQMLGRLIGSPTLVADPTMRGGGLHAVPRGGKLGIHIDFNRHRDLPLKRRLNTILYLNRTWESSWHGYLTLTNRGGEEIQRIMPAWNRWVIFGYGSEAWHGHPEPLECPEGVERRSAANYYYEPLAEELPFTGTQYK